MKFFNLILAIFLSGFQPFLAQNRNDNITGHTSPFIENKGQWDSNLAFRSEFSGGRIEFYNNKFRFGFLNLDDLASVGELHHNHTEESTRILQDKIIHGHIYDMEFVGANLNPEISGIEKQIKYHNYFLGKDKSKWAGKVSLFGQILYRELWEGIDLIVKENHSAYEYDFIVKPRADIAQIKLVFKGQNNLEIKNGKLIITTSVNTVIENEPYVYQVIDDRKVEIDCNYILKDDLIAFEFPKGYNPAYEMVIDPVLVFSTYSGSTADNWGFTATFNLSGNLYGAGIVFSSGYPTTTGAFQTSFAGASTDVGITKYTSDGTNQLYATYLGGSSTDVPHSMIVDGQDRLIVYGTTGSSDFPISEDAYDNSFNGGSFVSINTLQYNSGSDIFITKFNSSGDELIGSTFVGGTGNDGLNLSNNLLYNYGDEMRGEVFIDEVNQIYVASSTRSSDFPTTGGSISQSLAGKQDGCAFKMASDLKGMYWSTYIGGSLVEAAYSIKVTENDEAIICGGTSSSDFPTTAGVIKPTYGGLIDGYILNLNNSNGSLNHASYMGTASYDQSYFVEVDEFGDIYVLGQTKGSYPVSPDVYSNPNSAQFIHKISYDLQTDILSTVFGDESRSTIDISPTAFLVDNCENVYVSGWGGEVNNEGNTFGLPISGDAYQSTTNGSDFYFIVLEKDFNSLRYATYFGGSSTFEHVDGGTSRFDKKGVIYQAVCAGCGGSSDFPTTPGVWSTTNGSTNCNLGTIKMDVGFSGVFAAGTAEPNALGCAPFEVSFQSFSNGVYFAWNFGDGSPVGNAENPEHVYVNEGIYEVMFIAIDSSLCLIADTAYIQIIVLEPRSISSSFDYDITCDDLSVTLINTGTSGVEYVEYNWDMGDGTIYDGEVVIHVYDQPGTYNIVLTVTDLACQIDSIATQEITILPTIVSDFSVLDADFNILQNNLGCAPFELNFQNNSGGTEFIWDFGNGSPPQSDFEPAVVFVDPGIYEITLIVNDPLSCNLSDTSSIVIEVFETNYLLADFSYTGNCTDSLFVFTNTGTSGLSADSYFWDFGDGSTTTIENPIHPYTNSGVYQVTLFVNDTGFCSIPDTTSMAVQVLENTIFLADFEFTANCNDSLVFFENNGSLGLPPNNYFWNFGDGNTANIENPINNYLADGTYIVSLIVTDTGLCIVPDTAIIPLNVFYGLDLLADFNFSESCEDTSVIAINTGTSDPINAEYLWDMGDSTFYSGESVSHQYEQPGIYTIVFQITDIFCDTATFVSQQIELLPSILANFIVEPDVNGCSPFEVRFINNSLEGSSTSFTWDFGNNTGSDEKYPSLIYDIPSPIPYDVTLIVTDPQSCNLVDTQMVQITVHPGVHLDLITEQEICEGDFIVMDAGNAGSNYNWSTGEITQTIQIDEQGEYSVFVSNEYCDDSDTTYLTVHEHPNYIGSTELCYDHDLMLSALQNGSDYLWSTGDTTVSIIISESGLYWNSYLDNNYCERSDTILITLADEAEQIFVPNSFTPNGDGLNETWQVYGVGLNNSFEVQVFNRWGDLIWESKDLNASWDGTYKGNLSEAGVYAYKLYFYSKCYDRKIETIGSVLLIR